MKGAEKALNKAPEKPHEKPEAVKAPVPKAASFKEKGGKLIQWAVKVIKSSSQKNDKEYNILFS